ncbi:MAG: hypothetical protein IJF83_07615 [Methanobrevibacter sp.]|nr:hypothetical protein [Methanobrevibacter sp.]
MGICPRCGSWVDEGEPYCSDCSYVFDSSDSGDIYDSNVVRINGFEYDINDVEEALYRLGYDLDDLQHGFVDEDELEEILEDL